MKLLRIIEEDFTNYKLPCMFIATSICNWKCCTEQGYDKSICQNFLLKNEKTLDISPETIYNMYINNPITEAIVFGGLEPFDQFAEMLEIIDYIRKKDDNSPIIIYTGYYPKEIPNELNSLKNYNNIIVKFGRFILNSKHRFDEVLGVELASENQYAQKIS